MTYVTNRGDSRVLQFRMRVPSKVLPLVRGRLVAVEFRESGKARGCVVTATVSDTAKLSLRTTDPAVAEERDALVRAALARVYSAALSGPRPLSHKQLVALSGEVYRLYVERFEDDPGPPGGWAAWKAFCRAAQEGRLANVPPLDVGAPPNDEVVAREVFGEALTAGVDALAASGDTTGLERRFGRLTSWVLTLHGLEVDAATRVGLLRQVAQAALDAGWRLKRAASGDYSMDLNAGRFPPFERAGEAQPGIALTELFERWKRETKPAASTVSTWNGVVRSLKEHLGHEDVARITAEAVVGWKDALVSKGLSAKTIGDGYLAAVRRLFGYAVDNRLLKTNPAQGVRVAGKRRAGEAMQPYTDEEVGRLLSLARAEENVTRRWLPWLAALTGARIGELAQIWGANVRKDGDVYVLDLKPAPDGGTFKNDGSERSVPLHPALVAEGFLTFVEAKGTGPLFYAGRGRKGRGEDGRHASKGVTNRIASWIRESGFTDPRKAPAHALRHWFKSAAARTGVQDSIADAIQGHAGRTDAATYRHLDVATLARAVASIPVPTVPTDLERPALADKPKRSPKPTRAARAPNRPRAKAA